MIRFLKGISKIKMKPKDLYNMAYNQNEESVRIFSHSFEKIYGISFDELKDNQKERISEYIEKLYRDELKYLRIDDVIGLDQIMKSDFDIDEFQEWLEKQ